MKYRLTICHLCPSPLELENHRSNHQKAERRMMRLVADVSPSACQLCPRAGSTSRRVRGTRAQGSHQSIRAQVVRVWEQHDRVQGRQHPGARRKNINAYAADTEIDRNRVRKTHDHRPNTSHSGDESWHTGTPVQTVPLSRTLASACPSSRHIKAFADRSLCCAGSPRHGQRCGVRDATMTSASHGSHGQL